MLEESWVRDRIKRGKRRGGKGKKELGWVP